MLIDILEDDIAEITTNGFMESVWVNDFNNKNKVLREHFNQASAESLYVDLFGNLKNNCKLLINNNKKEKSNFSNLKYFIENYDTVFVYTQFFTDYKYDYNTGEESWYRRTMEHLIALKSFVIDLDGIRMSNIHTAIARINEVPVKPNYIVNSGNGLHLYYIFDKKHDVKASSGLMAVLSRRPKTECLKVYTEIKQGMIGWFSGFEFKSDTDNTLVQPTRLFGAKTKNPNLYTQIFKCSDTKCSIYQLANILDIDIPDEETLKEWKQYVKEFKQSKKEERRKAIEQKYKRLNDGSTYDYENWHIIDSNSISNSKYKVNWDEFKQKVRESDEEYKNSVEYIKSQEWYAENKTKRKNRKITFKDVQRKGQLSQYEQFKEQVRNVARKGNRRNCLHVFWNRALLYTNDKEMIRRDYDEMVGYFQTLAPYKDRLTDEQIDEILNGHFYQYSNNKIFQRTGLKIQFVNNKEKERQEAKVKREERRKLILELSEEVIKDNPDISLRKLTDILNKHGISISHKTVSMMEEIKEMKRKYKSSN